MVSWRRRTASSLVSALSSMMRPGPCRGTVTTVLVEEAGWPARSNLRPVLLYRCPARITRERSAPVGRGFIRSAPQLCGAGIRELREDHDALRGRVERV